MTGPARIVVDDAVGWATEAFGSLGTVVRVPGREITRAHLADADALVVRTVTRVDRALVEGTRLRFVGSATAGIDHVDTDALQRAGIAFASAAGCNAHGVVDYVVTALHLEALERDPDVFAGPIAIVGFGHVGRRLAQRLRALGATVRVCDPPLAELVRRGALDEADPWARLAIDEPMMSLRDAIAGARVLTLHVPRQVDGPHPTVGMIGAAELDALAPGATFINAARGDVVDGAALAAWLAAGRGRAILDVWPTEPEIDPALVLAPQVRIATPHIAGYTMEGKVAATSIVARALADHLGVATAWTGAEILGDRTPLLVSDHASALARATATLRRCNPIERDVVALRELARASGPRAAGFEALRRHYAWRRALAHHLVDGDRDPRLVAAGLTAQDAEALVLIAHGSPDPDWRRPIDALLAEVRARLPARRVLAAYLDHLAPSLADAVAQLAAEGAQRVRVVPIFLSPGGNHIKRDIPALCRAVADAQPTVALTLTPGAIGAAPAVISAIAAATVALSATAGDR